MRPLRLVFIALSAIFALAAAVGLYLYYTPPRDVIEMTFETHADAIKRSAFEKGMVPDFLPASAAHIISTRNLDLNETVIEFSYDPADFGSFLAKQQTTPLPAEYKPPRPNGGFIEMTPLSSILFVERVATEDEDSQGSLIINTGQRRALFTSRPRGNNIAQ